jgi:hypothetical protein
MFLTSILIMSISSFSYAGENDNPESMDLIHNKCELRVNMRKLWEDHITWTRVFIISALAGLPDTPSATKRLLKNQTDIGNAIKPFYGEAAGNQLTKLLRTHILLAAEIVTDLKTGNTTGAEEANKKWYQNANDIAKFLHAANPKNWPLDEMKMMMKSHLDNTTQEVLARVQMRWSDDVKAYDKVHIQILGMADMLTDGLIKQFPQ